MSNPPGEPARLRLFVAIELPEAWKAALAAQQLALRGHLGATAEALRWVRREGFHATLVFLGETDATEEPRIRTAMEQATVGVAPFVLNLGGAGTFGGRRPRVVWTGIEGDLEPLAALQRRLVEALGVGEAEAGRFSPHITLARVADRPGPGTRPGEVGSTLAAALARVPRAEVNPLAVREVSLVQSQLGRGGAVYTRRFAASLKL